MFMASSTFSAWDASSPWSRTLPSAKARVSVSVDRRATLISSSSPLICPTAASCTSLRGAFSATSASSTSLRGLLNAAASNVTVSPIRLTAASCTSRRGASSATATNFPLSPIRLTAASCTSGRGAFSATSASIAWSLILATSFSAFFTLVSLSAIHAGLNNPMAATLSQAAQRICCCYDTPPVNPKSRVPALGVG